MEGDKIVAIVVLVAVVGLLAFSVGSLFWGEEKSSSPTSAPTATAAPTAKSTATSTSPSLAKPSNTKTSDAGEVSVELTPKKFENGKFYLSMDVNTHSVSGLDKYNLKEIVALSYKGKSYKPVAVPVVNGHHNSGEIMFEMEEEPKEFKITITGLAAEGIREFSWP